MNNLKLFLHVIFQLYVFYLVKIASGKTIVLIVEVLSIEVVLYFACCLSPVLKVKRMHDYPRWVCILM